MITAHRKTNLITRRRALAAMAMPAVAATAGTAWCFETGKRKPAMRDAARLKRRPLATKRGAQPPARARSRSDVRREAASRAKKQLDWADEQSRKLVDECLGRVGAFFDGAKKGLPGFAKDALGLRSKCYLVVDRAWHWSSGDWQRTYLQERWEHHLFSNATLTAMLTQVAKQYADGVDDIDVLPLAKRYGPELVEGLERAGSHGDDVLKLFARRGDDALWITAKPGRLALFVRYGDDVEKALVRHRAVAQELITACGAPAGRAMGQLSGRQARRLVALSRSGELARIGRPDELLDVIARFGDRGCDFIWRNKLPLATAAVLAAFLADPEPFIDGTRELVGVTAKHIARPLTEAGGQVAIVAARRTNWTLIGIVGLVAMLAPCVWRRGFRRRSVR